MENKIMDPSEIGTSGLKGINTREGRERLEDKYNFSKSLADYKQRKANTPIELPYQEVGVVGLGDSTYDEDISSLTQLEDLEDTRSKIQPWYAKIGAGIGKGAVLAGTTFLDGTMGTLVGAMNMVDALRNGKSAAEVLGAFWNNPFAKAMKEVNDWAEEAMPNHMSQEERENQANGEWYKNVMTANWWGNSFIKNLGFTMGAFATGNLVSGALKNSPAIVKSLVGSTISAINEGKIEAYNNANDWYNLQEQKLKDSYSKYLETLEQNYGELDTYNDFLNEANKNYEESLAQLNYLKAKVGNVDLALNLAILIPSNNFMWGKLYAGGSGTAIRSTNIARRNGKYVSQVSPSKIITGPISEGFEEVEQKMASVIPGTKYESDAENFYKAKWDPGAAEKTLNWVQATADGIINTLGDSNTWEEFTIGAMTGAMGMPMFRSPKSEDGKFRSPIYLDGGIYGETRDYLREKEKTQSMVDRLNERVSSPEFRNYYQGIVRHSKYQEDMDRAAEEGDVFDYKNAEDSQLISDVIMFANAGRLNDLTEYINQAFDTSDENIQSIIENTTDEFGNGPFSEKGNPKPKDEIVKRLTESKDEILQTIETYNKVKDYVNSRLGDEISEDALEELVWLGSKSEAWNKRFNQLADEVKHQMRHTAGDIELRHPDRADLAESVRTLLSMPNEVMELVLSDPKNKKFVESLAQEAKRVSDTFGLDYADLSQKVADMAKIADASMQFQTKLREYIEKPEVLINRQDRDTEEISQEEQNRKNLDLKTKLSNATSVKEFGDILSGTDDVTRNEVMNTLDSEGNIVARSYKEVTQYDRELKKALNELRETDQVSQDALALWQEQFNTAENLNQLANPNSIYINNEGAFLEESGGDIDMAESRFQNARYALQRAMSKVNNDMKFRDRFSEEYRKPVDEPIRNKGVDKDTTGDSGTSTVPPVNPNTVPVETPSAPIGNVTTDMVAAENRDANRRVETQRTLDQSQQGQRRYYIPTIPELHIEASKEGDFRPFDEVVAEREHGANYKVIYDYLRDNGAFKYVNEGKLKVGDSLGFMIDPEFEESMKSSLGDPYKGPTIFFVHGTQVVGDVASSTASRYEGLEELIQKVRDEFAQRGEGVTGRFFATPQTRVSKIMVGRIPFTSEERSLADIPGVLDGDAKPVFGIIKNGILTTNEKIDDRLIIKPVDMAQKEGRLYLLIPNAAGTYSPAAVRVKHFNTQEFNLDDVTVANTPIGRDINEALDRLSDATSQDDVSIAMKELAKDLYMQDVMVTWFDAKAGSGVVISKKAKKPDGTYDTVIINGQEQIREDKYTIYFQSSKSKIDYGGMELTRNIAETSIKEGTLPADILNLFGQPRDISEIRRDILNTLLRFNLPLQVSISRINDSGYNNRIIKSNILTSNLREAKVIGSWFTTDHFDRQGNLQRSVSPSSIKPAPSRRTTTPVGGTEGVIQGTRVFVSGTPYIVDLKNSVATNEKTGEKRAFSVFNSQQLIDLAWAQETFGDLTESSVMTENKVITPKGEVLDRSTGKYIHGAEAQRIKDKIAGVNKDTVNTTSDSESEDSLPIFNSDTESLITKPEEQNRVLPENAFEEGGEVGYYELEGKVYTGYLKKIGEVEVTTGSGQKIMMPIHVTKVRDKGFGRKGELGPTSEYITVFPNGKAIGTKTNDKSDSYAAEVIMKALSANPEKVLSLSSEKTQIHNPGMLEEMETEFRNKQYSPEPTQTSKAAATIQEEDAINSHDEEFEDDLDLGELRRVDDMSRETWNQEKELAWLRKILPQLSEQDRLRVVKGLIQVAGKGTKAWGAYQNGIITLSDVAAEGTVYHEAFHAVFDLLLNEKEKKFLLEEAREKWGNLSDYDLKEELAEAFREYMTSREDRSLGRRILDFFKELFAKVTNFKFMKPSMTAYFQMVNQGRYAKETLGDSTQEEPEFRHWKDVYKKGRVIADYPMNSDINQYHKQNFMDKKGDSRMTRNGEGYHMFKEEVVRFHYMSDGELVIDKVVSRDSKEASKIREEIEFLKNLEDNPEEKSKFNKAFPNWNERSQEERDNAIECRGLNS